MRKLSLTAGIFAASVCILSAAASQAAGAKSGQKFGDWTVVCEGNAPAEICHIEQKIAADKEQKHIVLEIAVGKVTAPDGSKTTRLIIAAPWGVFLPKGLELQIDDTKPAQLPFLQCTPGGCRTMLSLADDGLSKFKNGSTAKITYYLPSGKPEAVTVSLKGFTSGFDAATK